MLLPGQTSCPSLVVTLPSPRVPPLPPVSQLHTYREEASVKDSSQPSARTLFWRNSRREGLAGLSSRWSLRLQCFGDDDSGISASRKAEGQVPLQGAQPLPDQPQRSVADRLRAAGTAGVISYGLLNTVYYLTAFFVLFFRVLPLKRGVGLQASARQALVLTPLVDSGLTRIQHSMALGSRVQVLGLVAAVCFGFATLVLAGVAILWA